MANKTTKKAHGVDFKIIENGYTPVEGNWKGLSQTIKTDILNTKKIKVNHNEKIIEVEVIGFHIPKEKNAKNTVFLFHEEYLALKF